MRYFICGSVRLITLNKDGETKKFICFVRHSEASRLNFKLLPEHVTRALTCQVKIKTIN